MKKGLILFGFALMLIGYFSCEKETENDYRDKWTGEYAGKYRSSVSSTMGGSWRDTIQEYIINILLESDSCILIKSEDRSWTSEINTDGYFEQKEHYPKCRGIIINDSISFFGINSMSAGHSSTYEYKGKKRKSIKQ